jgi:D-glycero-D-manno-heptose 1,7-bisphosphate phosphatase
MRKALFLDRDGIINVDRGYVGRIEDFEFVDGIFDLVRKARALGYVPVVVTNQSGIARGYFDEAAFHGLTAFMLDRFAEEGAPIERVYFCPTHPEAAVARYRREDPRRKPAPGMLLDAIAELGIEPARSVMIGDQWSDALAAQAAGVGRIALVGKRDAAQPGVEVAQLADLGEATHWLEAAGDVSPAAQA